MSFSEMNELSQRLIDDLLAGGTSGLVVAVVMTYVLRQALKSDVGPLLRRIFNLLVKAVEILKDGEVTKEELESLDKDDAS